METANNATYGNDSSIFDWSDYAVFFGMLITSALIGVYFGCFGSKQKTTAEYLLAGKSMQALPVGLSLVASHISGLTLIGVPSEVYLSGIAYWLVVPTAFFICVVVSYVFIPVFFNLNITSTCEYIEMRFCSSLRKAVSFAYIMSCLMLLSQFIYIPSLVLTQATHINLYVISGAVSAVCIFYTTIGGVKAVIWTDLVQTLISVVVCMVVVIIGTINEGGFTQIIKTAYDAGKLEMFNFDPNPFQRSNFWIMTIGTVFPWLANFAFSQGCIQRYKSVPKQSDAIKALFICYVGILFFTTLSVYGGVLLFAVYHNDDPVEKNLVSRPDQIFPFFVLDRLGYIPMLPGFFVTSVFSAALSSLSAALNSVSGLIYEDYIKRPGMTEERANMIMKALVVTIGIFTVITIPVIEKMGTVLAMSYKLSSVLGAPIFSTFMLGTLVPWANTKGAIVGGITGSSVVLWIMIGGILTADDKSDDVFPLYRLSFMLYQMVGFTIAFTIGIIVSYFTGFNDLGTIDPKLISPLMRRFLPQRGKFEFIPAKDSVMSDMKILKDNNFK